MHLFGLLVPHLLRFEVQGIALVHHVHLGNAFGRKSERHAMFFYAAKLIWFVAQPSSIIGTMFAVAAIACGRRLYKCAGRLLVGGLLALLVCGLTPLSDVLLVPLENRFARPDLDHGDPIAGLIVLGGVEDAQSGPARELAGLNDSAERITEAVALARQFPHARVVFTGGMGAAVLGPELPESVGMGRLLEALGVAKDRITLEARSRDTYENALYTRRLVNPVANERWLLITSAWHMPRAVGCFRKVGFPVEPWPVDYRTGSRVLAGFHSSIPKGLHQTDIAMKEYLGLLVYYVTGRIPVMLPSG
jgi:uncharacterized SAM-binding protein YcdF (DUF218 family)